IATFTVTLDNASSQIVTVDYATANNTATAGEDFTGANGTVIFNPGETSKTISVVVMGDSIDELDESFNVTLTNSALRQQTDKKQRWTYN
ncbi:MAG: Calx-beta domain-containing protein, partial [Cyanobacteria bacterium J06642_3]